MCRWIAYAGPPVTLETFITRPDHSLIDQSFSARQNFVPGSSLTTMFRNHAFPTNGDGFGIGWYGTSAAPGVYRDTTPAWNDANLHNIAAEISSPLFFAHVRAAYGGTVQRTNCHPFSHANWLFQYNGEINGFIDLKRDLTLAVAPELFGCIEGSTDTELCFYLALSFGLTDSPEQALARMVGVVEQTRADHGIADPFRATMATTDGTTIYGVRYSSNQQSKTLYYSRGLSTLKTVTGREDIPAEGRLLVSEPLEDEYRPEHWVEVPESSLVIVRAGEDPIVKPFVPIA